MNLGDLEEAFRIRVHDKVEPYFFSTEEVRSLANAAVDEAAIRSRCIRTVWSGSVVAGDSSIEVPYELLWVAPTTIRVTATATGAVTPMALFSDAEFASLSMFGAPTATTPKYLRIGDAINTVEFSPATDVDGTLLFTLARMPSASEQMECSSDELRSVVW